MTPQRDNEWKFLHFFMRDTKWVRSQTLSGCLAQPSTLGTMAKASTDVQAVVERLLRVVTACGMPFEGLLRMESKQFLYILYIQRAVSYGMLANFAPSHHLLLLIILRPFFFWEIFLPLPLDCWNFVHVYTMWEETHFIHILLSITAIAFKFFKINNFLILKLEWCGAHCWNPYIITLFCKRQNVKVALVLFLWRLQIFIKKISFTVQVKGKKNSTGARAFKISQHVNNMLYFFLK